MTEPQTPRRVLLDTSAAVNLLTNTGNADAITALLENVGGPRPGFITYLTYIDLLERYGDGAMDGSGDLGKEVDSVFSIFGGSMRHAPITAALASHPETAHLDLEDRFTLALAIDGDLRLVSSKPALTDLNHKAISSNLKVEAV